MKALKTNKLASHPVYPKILNQYNEQLNRDGKVNAKKFYEEVILPEIPIYHLQSWYKFLRRFKTNSKLIAAEVIDGGPNTIKKCAEQEFEGNLVNNEVATRLALQYALNIAYRRLREVFDNPQLMTVKDAIDLIFKVMKAQDSRVHAVAKIKEDTRNQEKFERLLNEAAYGEL